jgi:hypothetical protein
MIDNLISWAIKFWLHEFEDVEAQTFALHLPKKIKLYIISYKNFDIFVWHNLDGDEDCCIPSPPTAKPDV